MHIEENGIAKIISFSRLCLPLSPISLAIGQASLPALEDDLGDESDSSQVTIQMLVVQPSSVVECNAFLAVDWRSVSAHALLPCDTECTFKLEPVGFFS